MKTTKRTAADPSKALLDHVLRSLDGDKAEAIVTLELAGKTTIADYMVIADGRSTRHVGAIADHMLRRLKDDGYGSCQSEGMPQCDWVLIDAGDVIVHIFRPEIRAYYNLEKMWSVDVPAEDSGLQVR